jgi:hypothetical protein
MFYLGDAILIIFLLFLSRKIAKNLLLAESFRHGREEEEGEEIKRENLFFSVFSWLLFFVSALIVSISGSMDLIVVFQLSVSLLGLVFLPNRGTFKLVLSEYGFRAVFAGSFMAGIFVVLFLAFLS